MVNSLLTTKLIIAPSRTINVLRPRLIARLNEGQKSKLTLVSAHAGFGKTTLVSEWARSCGKSVAWLSLDKEDNELVRFLTYLVAAMQTVAPEVGGRTLMMLQSPQLPAVESILTDLINEIIKIARDFVLILDDFHYIDAEPIANALSLLLDNLPPQLRLLIMTREDVPLPLPRMRARGELTELRAADLRFNSPEAAEFLNQVMGLNLSEEDITALEDRTEGWIAGLQLAALSLQGHHDTNQFIQSFTGSHRFILDYLMEEVLKRQSPDILDFLRKTSLLSRLCGTLCDYILGLAAGLGQETLERLDRINLFIIPLDTERHWYRYHHLFAELLRQRLVYQMTSQAEDMAIYHLRASRWFEDKGLDIEAFQHAAAASDYERAERLLDGKGIPLHQQSALGVIIEWLVSLSPDVLESRPSLRVRHASLLLVCGKIAGVEEILQAAETTLEKKNGDNVVRDLLGSIAAARATLALSQYKADTIIIEAKRALEYLNPENRASRLTAMWTLAFAYQFQGARAEAARVYHEVLSTSRANGNVFFNILSLEGIALMQEYDNQLYQAAETYQGALELFCDKPQPYAAEIHLALARIHYEWNDLGTALRQGQQSLQLALQYGKKIDRYISCKVFLVRLRLAQGDIDGAGALLTEVDEEVRRYRFIHRVPELTEAPILFHLAQEDIASATDLAEKTELPLSQARVALANGEPIKSLAILEPLRNQMEAKDWKDELLKVTTQTISPNYANRLLAVFTAAQQNGSAAPQSTDLKGLLEPLSQRELEVLQCLAEGLSNQRICDRLFLALSTVKGHNMNIFYKLQVKSRSEAIARARKLGLI